MYAYLCGRLADCNETRAIIDVGGVGYLVNISRQTATKIIGDETAKLYTHLAVKEDDLSLYGFATEEEKELFQLLLTVSGVGPKAAMAILSELTVDQAAAAIASEDFRALSRANGVGAKMAQRVCMELKEKVMKSGISASSAAGQPVVDRSAVTDALAALIQLGYARGDATRALQKCTADNVEDLIRQALRYLAG